MTRDIGLWEDLLTQPFEGDHWGLKTIQIMLKTLGHDPGPIDGVRGNQTTGAVKTFQQVHGEIVDGIVGPHTRMKLFLAYMDTICRDDHHQPFRVQKSDFLAQGIDPAGK